MSNIQKSFKTKSKGLRVYASGGLLDSFNKRMSSYDDALIPGTSTAAGTLSASNELEDANRDVTAGLLKDRMGAVQDTRGLSVRQRNRSLASLASMGAAQGVDTGFQPTTTGMSVRGSDELNNGALRDQLTRNNFDLSRQQRGLTAALADERRPSGFENGGQVKSRADQLMEEMAAKYGTGSGAPAAAPAPALAPAPAAPAPAPQAPPREKGIMGILRGRSAQIDKAAGYAHGGTVDEDGYIHGEKGVDKVAGQVAETGEPILVGDGERIVNKAQNKALEELTEAHGVDLDDYLEKATGKPVGPKMKKGLRAAAEGWVVDAAGNVSRAGQVAGALPAPGATPVTPNLPSTVVTSVNPVSPAVAPAAAGPSAARVGGQLVGKAIKYAAPAMAAYDTVGDDAIRVQGTRESDPGYADQSGVERVVAAAKELGLRAGDWGTSGLGYLGDWALPKGEKGFNEAYRDNMRDANLQGVTIPMRGGSTPAPAAAPAAAPGGMDMDTRSDDQRAEFAKQNDTELKGLRAAQQLLGSGAQVPADMKLVRQNETNAPMAVWNTKDDAAAKTIGNGMNKGWIKPQDGTGIISRQQPDGSYKNVTIGQSEYTGADGKPTSDWSKTAQYAQGVAQAEKDKASLNRILRERAMFDATSDQITDPAARTSGMLRMAQYNREDAEAAKAKQHSEEVGLRRGLLDMQGRQLDQQDRHFNAELAARAASAKAAESKARIADLDKLIEDQGIEDPKEFRDNLRTNFFGRKIKIDGKEVDVPGMEDMSADQMRALMPHAVLMHKFNKGFNAASENGQSNKFAKKVQLRDANYMDVEKNSLGIPRLFTSDNPNKLPLFGERSWLNAQLPKALQNQSYGVVEELLPDGTTGRRGLRANMSSGNKNLDELAYLESLK